MLARNLNEQPVDAHEAFASTLRRNSVFPSGSEERDTVLGLGMSAFQLVSQSLEGPFGLHAPTLFAALGSLSGYAAKWAVSLDIADGLLADDFRRQPGDGGRDILFSDHVRELMTGLSKQSVLSIVLGAAARANARSFDRLEAFRREAIVPGASNAMPDYGVDARFTPQFPPEALLMMLWENVGRTFRAGSPSREMFPLGLAYAAAHALGVWRDLLPADIAASLFMHSALAMAKIDRAF